MSKSQSIKNIFRVCSGLLVTAGLLIGCSTENDISGIPTREELDVNDTLSTQAVTFTTLNSLTPEFLAKALLGSQVTIHSATFTGDKSAAGTFSATSDDPLGLNEGVFLNTNYYSPGDADLSAVLGVTTTSAAALNITFTPSADLLSLTYSYKFTSADYLPFKDGFAAFVNGVNYALYKQAPVSVGNFSLQVETFNFPVNPGVKNTIKIVIANAYDTSYDAAVYLGAPIPENIPTDTVSPDTTITAKPGSLTNSNSASFTFSGSDNVTAAEDLKFECRLDGAAFAACTSPKTYEGLADGEHAFEVRAMDAAGNVEATPASHTWTVDTTPPVISWSSGINDGDSFFYGSVPAAPSCTASDPGDVPCAVSGYSDAVGSYTLTATATDTAGNTAKETRSYTVLAWTLSGFYNPLSSAEGVYNSAKAGSTVPMKFEVHVGSVEQTSTSAVKSFSATKVTCDTGTTEESVDFVTTGGTSLRYDSTAGQFIQNWQTPTTAGCYQATMTTLDGSSLKALFRLR